MYFLPHRLHAQLLQKQLDAVQRLGQMADGIRIADAHMPFAGIAEGVARHHGYLFAEQQFFAEFLAGKARFPNGRKGIDVYKRQV